MWLHSIIYRPPPLINPTEQIETLDGSELLGSVIEESKWSEFILSCEHVTGIQVSGEIDADITIDEFLRHFPIGSSF